VPGLATSWKVDDADPTRWTFTLRDGVKFHDGTVMTADDVVYTMNYFADPKLKVRFKSRYDWPKTIEKLSEYKVRITSKEPLSSDLFMLAYRSRVFDSKILSKLDNPNDYGRVSASATGPYKINYVDKNKGIMVERVENYFGDAGGYYRAPVKRVHGIPLPDAQSQIAQLMTGGVDLLRLSLEHR
jgi:peptide/nickel transport system substrate-binding protein